MSREMKEITQKKLLFRNEYGHFKAKELKTALEQAQNKSYYILLWDPPIAYRHRKYSVGNVTNCGRCEIGFEENKASHPDTKAIVFRFYEINITHMPSRRRNDQFYVWWSEESPFALRSLCRLTMNEYNHVFNLTMSYRRDSDVYSPYGMFENILQDLRREGSGNVTQDIEQLVADKKHLAIWIVSNCKRTLGARKRKALADALYKAGLALDRRGTCYSSKLLNRYAIKKYKFYLSFENSEHCTDYITEKFFVNAHRMGAVPVVWGAKKSDYEAIAPPHSFIFAEDYTVPELVRYLNYLNKNTTAYMEYFKWRTKKIESMPQYGRTIGFCNLCRIIHGINVDNIFNPNYPSLQKYIPLFGHPNRSRVVPSLNKWFYGNEPKECVGG